ncbi:hypothetical protein TRIUR3_06143 [Triticum urartu]|uniref:F-box domain-containing protein n=1 Tax=Triticum urartu TaxID=4572 RepID=M7ZRL1_TRIUA|nr:uncharacterized protein LOC125506550 [Triticum urartu]XP_048527298.1 uncharacterized protein LOC125506550 [Triticum urartu]XP_048527312.1 uncharacterized protein LOC125506565 [Triticum urartu]XP_048527313.1 uncharacterized protein LOC125506565 [Triticum urartu]EMS50739.1 hypothetical protein TRIUR3_06143 [Triticum urartu]
MSSEPLPPPPAAKPPSIPSTTALATAADGTTTISSLGQDQLLDIFLRLPNLPDLVRAALTCRPWLCAVRSSPSFRRLFRALHPAPLLGIFLKVDDDTAPSFAPLRRSDPVVTAALRRGDFFLTSLPLDDAWTVTDCRDGYVLLWNTLWAVAVVNPMTWAVDVISFPDDVADGSLSDFGFLGFHLLTSDENPRSFRVVCLCADVSRVRAAVFSSDTRGWAVHPWVEIGGENSLKYGAGTMVDGSVYWPFYAEGRIIKINTASSVDLPSHTTIDYWQDDFIVGDTKDGELCIVRASDDFRLHVWIRSVGGDGIGIWVRQNMLSLGAEIDRVTRGLEGQVRVVQVRSGCVYFSMTRMTNAGTQRTWFFYLSLETMEIELLIHGTFDDCAFPYHMAWPPCLIGDDGSTGHEVEASC